MKTSQGFSAGGLCYQQIHFTDVRFSKLYYSEMQTIFCFKVLSFHGFRRSAGNVILALLQSSQFGCLRASLAVKSVSFVLY